MQGLLSYPRDNGMITAGEVTALLRVASPKVTAGLELYWTNGFDIDPVANAGLDISDVLLDGSSVAYDNTAKVGGTASLNLDPAVWEMLGNPSMTQQWAASGTIPGRRNTMYWGNPRTRLRPYMTFSAEGMPSAKFYCGVYIPASPQTSMDSGQPIYSVSCYDLTSILDVPLTQSFTYPVGYNIINAVVALVTLFTIPGHLYMDILDDTNGALSTRQLAAPMSWGVDSGATYLDVINALLSAAGCYNLWSDDVGFLHISQWADPRQQGAGWDFDATDGQLNIIDPSGSWQPNIWQIPNTWVFTQNGLTGAPIEGQGQYTVVNQSSGPTSIDRQFGRVYVKHQSLDAATQTDLVSQGTAVMIQDTMFGEQFTVNTSPLPIAGHADVVAFTSDNIEPNLFADTDTQRRLCYVTSWQMPLNGDDMTWNWATIG